MAKDKKKKKKQTYVDDGRTIADMSSMYGNRSRQSGGSSPRGAFNFRPGHTPKDWAKTYWEAVKLNIIPMFVTIGIICAAFALLYLILELAS